MPGTTFPTQFTSNERANSRPVHLYTFARGDSQWRYTDAPEDITVSSVTYRAAEIAHDILQQDTESAAHECTVTTAQVTPVVTALDALGLAGLPVTCTIRQTHTAGIGGVVTPATAVRFKGVVQSRTLRDGSCQFVVGSLASVFDRPLLRVIAQPTCNWTVYGRECGVDPAGFTNTGCAISAISDLELTVADAALEADGYYTAGYATVETGPAAGERLYIRDHTGTALTVLNALPPGLTTAHTLAITAGCDGLEATCETKFANLDYFGGFPRVPTLNPFTKAE